MNHETLIVTVIALISAGMIAYHVIENYRYTFEVPEGWAGLLYRHGLYVRRNNAGRHTIWGAGWSVRMVDTRETLLPIAGQEVLTADNIGLKLVLLVTYQVAEPAKATHETQNWHSDLHHVTQLAVGAIAGGIAAEALLGQRHEIGAKLLTVVQPQAAKIGVNVHTIRVKDVILPTELKRAFSERLEAKLGACHSFVPLILGRSALHAGAEGAD